MSLFKKVKKLLHGDLDLYENFDYSNYLNTIAPGSMPANEFLQYMVRTYAPSIIVEVGSFLGWSAMGMAKQMMQNNTDGVVICVDTWMGGADHFDDIINERGPIKRINGYPVFYYNFLANMCYNGLSDIVVPFAYPSNTAADILQSQFIKNNIVVDMVYIDGSHIAQDVFNDCQNYYNLLKKDGVLFGDDWQSEGVKYGILEFCKSENVSYPKILSNGVHWIINKI